MKPATQVPAPSLPGAAPPTTAASDDDIHLSEYFDILLDRKWLVATVTAIVLLLGVAYAVLSTPVYQSNLLIQVEDSTPTPRASSATRRACSMSRPRRSGKSRSSGRAW